MAQVLRIQALAKIVGVVTPYLGVTEPLGFLLCNGQAVDRREYSALFGEIGLRYGTGDGSTTFNIPDMRGRFIKFTTDTSAVGEIQEDNLNASGFTVDPTNNVAHTHANKDSVSAGAHTHRYVGESSGVNGNTVHTGGSVYEGYGWTEATADHGHSVVIDSDAGHTHNVTLSGGDAETRPVNMATNYLISTGA